MKSRDDTEVPEPATTGISVRVVVLLALAALVGVIAYGAIVRRIEPVDWAAHDTPGEAAAAK